VDLSPFLLLLFSMFLNRATESSTAVAGTRWRQEPRVVNVNLHFKFRGLSEFNRRGQSVR
jgi:hypothetical protein